MDNSNRLTSVIMVLERWVEAHLMVERMVNRMECILSHDAKSFSTDFSVENRESFTTAGTTSSDSL